MKILHLLYESRGDPFGIGGVGVRAYEIYRRLSDRHRITFLCRKYPGAKDGIIDGIPHLFAGKESSNFTATLLAYARKAASFVRKNSSAYDVIIEDFSPAVPTFLSMYRKMPVIGQIQGYTGLRYFKKYNPGYAIPLYIFELVLPRFYKNLIFVSEESKKRYRIGHGRNVAVISNGIAEDLTTLESRESGTILYLGRIDVYSKGLDVLLEAFSMMSPHHPGIKLVIAGDGRDREPFMKLLGRLPAATKQQIELKGWVGHAEKCDALSRASVVVVPSRHETQGIVALEAAAAAKPLVISAIDELLVLERQGCAVSFPPGNSALLAKAFSRLLRDKPLRIELGTNGRAWARRFLWDEIAWKYEAFITEASGKHSRR